MDRTNPPATPVASVPSAASWCRAGVRLNSLLRRSVVAGAGRDQNPANDQADQEILSRISGTIAPFDCFCTTSRDSRHPKEITMRKVIAALMLTSACFTPAFAQTKTPVGQVDSKAECQSNFKAADKDSNGTLSKAEIDLLQEGRSDVARLDGIRQHVAVHACLRGQRPQGRLTVPSEAATHRFQRQTGPRRKPGSFFACSPIAVVRR